MQPWYFKPEITQYFRSPPPQREVLLYVHGKYYIYTTRRSHVNSRTMFFFMMNFTHNRTIYREETSQELFPRKFKNEKRLCPRFDIL